MTIPAPFQLPIALGGPPDIWLGLTVCLLIALIVSARNAWVERIGYPRPRREKRGLNYPNSSPSKLPPLSEANGSGRNGFGSPRRRAR
jgi:hypothetical protein